ncbi:MAG: hypothetical protein A3H27_11685 [Acidobacteria bacterium RIFCSPLOWO2_02_FULL_59_13]|nr:MAG: hypothetical protein A3H27_11685 [Acidobacteria bacterium RIFCSPLOWO2_02_FULL_59_13]
MEPSRSSVRRVDINLKVIRFVEGWTTVKFEAMRDPRARWNIVVVLTSKNTPATRHAAGFPSPNLRNKYE